MLLLCYIGSVSLSQVYKVIVNVGRQEWFVFRRYAEFDKLYNIVSGSTVLQFYFHLTPVCDPFRLIVFFLLMQLRKQFPSMNLKIPAKRIFGDNFEPGKCG